MRIYMTHCSAKKDDSLKNTDKEVTPDRLYTATPTQRFMSKCKEKKVHWAIFSDYYGVWCADIKHKWYGDDVGDPNKVTEQKFKELLNDFDRKLQNYDEIWFYYNPGRFHPLYERLLQETRLRDRIKCFTHIREIV